MTGRNLQRTTYSGQFGVRVVESASNVKQFGGTEPPPEPDDGTIVASGSRG